MYATTTSARSTSSRSSSSRRTSESRRSNGPAKTSRSSSRCATALMRSGTLRAAPDGPDAHHLADVRHRGGRERARLPGALLQEVLEAVLVGAQVRVALAHG